MTAQTVIAGAIKYNLPVDVEQDRFHQYADIWANAAVLALREAGYTITQRGAA